MNLRRIVEPLTVPEFLVRNFGTAPVHMPGPSGRFALLAGESETADRLARSLASTLERDLEAPVEFESEFAPGPCKCDCDLLVLLAAGRELWKIYARQSDETAAPELVAPLEAGGALYIPRGFRYLATTEEGSPIRRIFRIRNPTGAELLKAITEILRETDAFQKDIPRFGVPAAQSAYLSELRRTVASGFRSPHLLERFRRRLNNRAMGGAAPGIQRQVLAGDVVQLATPRVPRIRRVDSETILIRVRATDHRFPVEAADLLQYVLDKAPFVVEDFCRDMEGEFDRSELFDFLAALLRDGIVAMADSEAWD